MYGVQYLLCTVYVLEYYHTRTYTEDPNDMLLQKITSSIIIFIYLQ